MSPAFWKHKKTNYNETTRWGGQDTPSSFKDIIIDSYLMSVGVFLGTHQRHQ